jgi:small subunit ribosomal protein S6
MKKAKNATYEMMVIVKPLLPDDIRKVVHKSIVDLCKNLEGEVKDVDVWGKRYLSYKIASNTEGYYLVYTFSLPTSTLKEFKRVMDLKQEILRYLLLRIEEGEIVNKNYVKKKEMEVNF